MLQGRSIVNIRKYAVEQAISEWQSAEVYAKA